MIFVQGTGRDIGGPISFLAYNFGSPNWCQLGLSGHSCYTPRLGAMKTTMGDFTVADCSQFLEKRYEDPEWEVPKAIIVWGNNPTTTDPDGFFGHWIVDCMKRGSQIISVDPRHTWMTTRARYHLRLRPGTGGALALGMLNVIINEGLYDKPFVDKWTTGFDKLKERVQEYPTDKVEKITEVPKKLIEEAARFYAKSKPAAIQWGVAVDMEPEAVSVSQAITHLWCVTGNVDNPGGNVIARPSHGVTTYPYTTEELLYLYGQDLVKLLNEKRIGADKYPMVKGFRGWAHPDMAIEQIDTGKPYPIKAAWIQTANVLGGQAARARLHYQALKKLDFVVIVDLFHNPTTMALADIILPAATFAEKDSFRSWWAPLECHPEGHPGGRVQVRLGDQLRDGETAQPQRAEVEQRNGAHRWPPCRRQQDLRGARGQGVLGDAPQGSPLTPYRRHERGLLRADGKPGFNTPSGKIEFWDKALEGWGLDPLPHYVEPPQSPVSTPELYKKYPLIMITGARSSLFFHSEHRMIPWLREKAPWPIVEIHPDTAKRYGIDDGEWVYIQNDMGRVKRKAKITIKVKPQHIQTLHGWWMPEMKGPEPDLFGCWDYQINQIVPGPQCSKAGFGGGQYKTTLVTLAKIKD